MDRTFVFGDIHGCHKPLKALLNHISPDQEKDTLVFLGDYINRGDFSKEVISELISIKKIFRNVITLMGNHEQIFLSYLRGDNKDLFLRMGGAQTLISYGVSQPWPDNPPLDLIPPDHHIFFNELLLSWEDKGHIFVHAGMQPGVHLSQQTPEWLLWARGEFFNSNYDFNKRVIYGHTPFKEPRIEKNKIGIDTGLVFGGTLSCLILPDLKFISQY